MQLPFYTVLCYAVICYAVLGKTLVNLLISEDMMAAAHIHNHALKSQALQHTPRPVVAYAASYQTGDFVGMHQHPRAQLLYAVQGVMRVRTAGNVWTIPPRQALWIPAGVSHSHTTLSPVELRTLYLTTDVAAPLGEACYVLGVSALLKELILALLREPVAYPQPGRGDHLVALILSEIAGASRLAAELPWPADRRLQQVCQWLLDAPDAPGGIEQLAARAGASSRTLNRLFQKETGLRYRQWLAQVQLSDALVRLDRGEAVQRIAQQLGYKSAAAFSAMFRKQLGCAPQQYRRQGAAG